MRGGGVGLEMTFNAVSELTLPVVGSHTDNGQEVVHV